MNRTNKLMNPLKPRYYLLPNNFAEWTQSFLFLSSTASDVDVHGLHRHEGQLLHVHRRTPPPPPLPAVHGGEHDHVDVPVGVVVVRNIYVCHVVVVIVVIIVVVIVVVDPFLFFLNYFSVHSPPPNRDCYCPCLLFI